MDYSEEARVYFLAQVTIRTREMVRNLEMRRFLPVVQAVGMPLQPSSARSLGVVWIDCPPSVVSVDLVRALEKQARVHQELEPPSDVPSCVIICPNGQGIAPRMWNASGS